MSDSAHPFRSRPSEPHEDGLWELDLWDGTAWFSDWFYMKLQWTLGLTRKTLVDLQSYMQPDAWDALLSGIREHLEQRLPLALEFSFDLPDGRTETWAMTGSAEFNAVGQPIYIAGSMQEVGAMGRNLAQGA
jgi:hypothetical protein